MKVTAGKKYKKPQKTSENRVNLSRAEEEDHRNSQIENTQNMSRAEMEDMLQDDFLDYSPMDISLAQEEDMLELQQ